MSTAYNQAFALKRLALGIGLSVLLLAALLIGSARPAAAASYTTHITLTSSTGAGIPGGTVKYWISGGWTILGTTDASGVLAVTVPQQHYRIQINYNKGAVDTGTPVDITNYGFNTVSVKLLNTGQLAYQGWYMGYGSPAWVNSMELLPYTYSIWNNSSYPTQNKFNLTVGAENVIAVNVRLLDSSGHGLQGGTLSYYLGGWQNAPGTTDADGDLVVYLPSDSQYLSMAMTYNGTSQQMNRTQLDTANFTFKTAAVNVKLVDADGAALDTGSASYYAGSWRTIGDTSGGVIALQMLPGSYSFAMAYNGSGEQRDAVAISTPATDVVFQTGRVTLQYSGPISWYYGYWRTFTKPTMEYLPGTTRLYFGSGPACALDFPIQSGDHLVKSVIVAKLKNSGGQPLAGGIATTYVGGWRAVGTTNTQGTTCAAYDGNLGNTAVAMVYNGTRQQISQQHATNSDYKFSTATVTVELHDSSNAFMDTGSASYYAGSWRTIGDTSGGAVAIQMLPGSYSFAMVYNGTREQKNAVMVGPGATTVTFATVGVSVNLSDSHGNPLDIGDASYYAGSWRSIGSTAGGSVGVQMLPGSYSFAMTYLGTREQQNGVTISSGSSDVTFKTGTVTSGSNTATSYYATSWRPFTSGMELLSGKYWFDFSDATPNTLVTIVGGQDNPIH